jgi:Rrf2 family protein
VKVSAKTEYACIAMLELAASYGSGEPVQVRRIADKHGIPSRFLVQILLQLKGAGLVASTRGASGGYELLKSPEEVSLSEVMSVIEGAQEFQPTSSAAPDSVAAQVLLSAWQEVTDVEQDMLRNITFAELCDRARQQSGDMYHI